MFLIFLGTAQNCLSEKSVWLVILLTTVVCVVPGLVISFLRVVLFPTLTDKVQYEYNKEINSEHLFHIQWTGAFCFCVNVKINKARSKQRKEHT